MEMIFYLMSLKSKRGLTFKEFIDLALMLLYDQALTLTKN